MVEKTVSNENENKITIAMCKKLLATNIVANSFLGLESNLVMEVALEEFTWERSERFFGVKEKRATSAAATIAQQKSNTTIPIIPNNKLVSKVENKVKLGSGSKLNEIS